MVAEFKRPSPPPLFDRHLAEWVEESGVSEEIARANVKSFSNSTQIKKLLGWQAWKNGAGWWVTGIDPETGDRRSWGQFKADVTPLDKNGEPMKYLTPKGRGNYEPQFLEVPSQPDFWREVISDPSVETVITEGAKKAGCLLTHGIPAICLPGVSMGQLGKGIDPDRPLLPDLEKFAVEGRSFIVAFDADIQIKPSVLGAMLTLSERLVERGCSVKTFDWDEVG